uniref:NADH-ubiquinone oxidoreductase chain 6 n=1 Tax=Margarites vorticiferus TaxID=1172988 RepID=A0A1W5YRX1_9VEST|nr:NADH dehydrogenase subunit 6 [Margarites vorticiferus]
MSIVVISSLCMSLMVLMPSMAQPLSLGLCVMVLSVMSCIMVGLFTASWYGYVLFLVYVGGLLVMFAYVSALAPNTFFSSAKAFVAFFCSFLVLFIGFFMVFTPDFSSLLVSNYVDGKMFSMSGSMLVSPSSVSLLIVLGIVLLVNLLAVVKVCYYQQGPLRSHLELK